MDQVLQDVEISRSDIGVLFFTSDSRSAIIKACNRRNIFFQHLKYDLLHIYIQNTHPLAERKSVTLADIQQYPFISYEECHPSSARFTTTRRQWNPQQQIISVSDRAMAYSLLALGDAYVDRLRLSDAGGSPPLLGQCAHHGSGTNRDRVYL